MAEKTLNFPELGDVKSPQSYVIVGANGSGKTRLGAWIENSRNNVLRISAQRALSIPTTIKITNGEAAWNKIMYGNATDADKGHKWNWGKETSALVNDYESVLSSVFSKALDEFNQFQKSYNDGVRPNLCETVIDHIINIWETVFPQRDIVLEKFQVSAQYNHDRYHAGAMSDGERVGLYLIAQCLITPDDHIIVIDEPETHLHTSIMKRLWDEIEKYCPDKTFVYITHDLKFASSRKGARKIWVRDYDGKGNWSLSLIDDNEDIPEALMFEVLGTRSPVLFVEGEKSSYDLAIYREVYPEFHVIGCANCQKVRELTKAFNNDKVKNLHQYEVKGLIDHDFLSEEEIKSLNKNNIYTTEVLEVENLFLIEPLIRFSARQLGNDEDKVFEAVSEELFKRMAHDKNDIINAMAVKEIRYKLGKFGSSAKSKVNMKNEFTAHVSSIDAEAIFDQAANKVEEILRTRDYVGMLMTYNNKGLCSAIKGTIGLKKPLQEFILDLMNGEKKKEIIDALKTVLPSIDAGFQTPATDASMIVLPEINMVDTQILSVSE